MIPHQYQPGDVFERGRERITLGTKFSGGTDTYISGGVYFDSHYRRKGLFSAHFPAVNSGTVVRVYAGEIPAMLADGWRHVSGPTWQPPSDSSVFTFTCTYPEQKP